MKQRSIIQKTHKVELNSALSQELLLRKHKKALEKTLKIQATKEELARNFPEMRGYLNLPPAIKYIL